MNAHAYRNATDASRTLTVRLDDMDWALLGKEAIRRAVIEIAEKLAAQYIAEHGAEILAAISPESVATNTMAAAGAAVNETLQKKWPDKVVEVTRTEREVWQRGILGGMRRL